MLKNINKKNKKTYKILAAFLAASTLTTALTGCFDPVFSSVRKEVKLENAAISGFINSIVRFTESSTDPESGSTKEKEYLFLQNGRIYFKEISDDNGGYTKNAKNQAWTHDSSFPASLSYNYDNSEYDGRYVCRLASDSKYIYALAFTPVYNETYSRNEPRDLHLYYTSSVMSGWTEITSVTDAIKDYVSRLKNTNFMMDSSIQLFCTNSPKKEHRKAFIRIGGGSPYYTNMAVNQEYNYGNKEAGNYGIIELNGGDTDAESCIPFGENGASHKSLSAVYFDEGDGNENNNIHFFNTSASDTNETFDEEATYVYFGNGSLLSWYSIEDYKANLSESSKYINSEDKLSDTELALIDAEINGFSTYDSDGSTKKSLEAPENVIQQTTGVDSNSIIISLCLTKTSIIIGTKEYGAYRAMLKNGKPDSTTKEFDSNASTIMTKPYVIPVLLNTNPAIGEEEEGSAIYSSMIFHYTQSTASADYDNVGLWSYYKSRGNWNRE